MNKPLLIRLLLLLLAITSLAGIMNMSRTGDVAAQSQTAEIELLVDDYVGKMKMHDFGAVLAMLPADKPGHDALIHNAVIQSQNLGDAELQALKASTTAKAMLSGQFEFIIRKFGADAWENVDYQILPVACPEKTEHYYTTDGERWITAAEAMVINDQYWQDFAQARGLDPTEFFQPKQASGERPTGKALNILTAKESGSQPPAKVVLADAYECYAISLTFNGRAETADGECAFTIQVDRKSGTCNLSSGLCWDIECSDMNVADR